MLATVIADDLTGACDAGALFAGRARVHVVVADAAAGAEWDVLSLDTESRALDAAAAAARVREIARRHARRLDRGVLFKKIDSTLRGAVGAELQALLDVTGRRTAVVCPAFPAQSRTVREGVLLVGGVPAHRSAIGRDPAYPGATSDVALIVKRGTAGAVGALPLDRVRGDRRELARWLARTDGIVVADAEVDADLDRIATAAVDLPDILLAGSAGLARAVAMAHGHAGASVPLPDGRAWLIVAGSVHPATRAQLHALETAGVAGVRLLDGGEADVAPLHAELDRGRPVWVATRDEIGVGAVPRDEPASRLARLAAGMLERSRPDLVVVTGGDTAAALLRATGAERIELLGVPASGLALGDIVTASSRVPVLTKAGGFGAAGLFLGLWKGTA